MPLPAGFKLNGAKIERHAVHIPPRIKKIMTFLDKLPTSEVVTSRELADHLSLSLGAWSNDRILVEYREKIDNKLFWGSRKSIVELRKRLNEPEETDDQN